MIGIFVTKNKEYLYEKRNIVNQELLGFNQATENVTVLVSLGKHQIEGENGAKAIKKFQLKILDWLDQTTPRKIAKVLNQTKTGMCLPCQAGLQRGEVRCHKDLKTFIFCDMMRRSIQEMFN